MRVIQRYAQGTEPACLQARPVTIRYMNPTTPPLKVGDVVAINAHPNTGRAGTVVAIDRRPFGLDYLIAVDGRRERTYHAADELTGGFAGLATAAAYAAHRAREAREAI